MTDGRLHHAEHLLGWDPMPDEPRLFKRRIDRAGRVLVNYVLDHKPRGRRSFADTLDRIVGDALFCNSPIAFQAAVLHRAGIAHNWMGVAESNVTELMIARKLLATGLEIVPEESANRARIEYALANTLLNMAEHGGDLALLDDAIAHARRSVMAGGVDQQLRARCLAELARILSRDFLVRGGIQKITEATDHAEEAVHIEGMGSRRTRFLLVLSAVLSSRYDVNGSLDDLSRAIALVRECRTNPDPVALPAGDDALSNSLGSLLRRRYMRTGNIADLDEAIHLLSSGLRRRGRPDPARLTNLGNALLDRFVMQRDTKDLSRAIDLQLKAVKATDPGDWYLASRHNNAGNALSTAWRINGEPRLWDLAIEHRRSAIRLTADNAPERPSREYNLGMLLQYRCEADGGDDLIEEAVTAYRDAVRHGFDTSLEWALDAARHWAEWAVARGSWAEAAVAYSNAFGALQRLFAVQLLREDKSTWLAAAQGLPAEAGYALFRADRLEDAVTTLEAGRSMLLSEVLERDRADLARLSELGHSALVQRYRAANTALDEATRRGAEPAELRVLRTTIDEVVKDIRAVPTYEQFRLPPDIKQVRASVTPGTVIVYIAAATLGGVALAVDPEGGVRAVELPLARSDVVARRVQSLMGVRGWDGHRGRRDGTLDAVLRWAWSAVVESVLEIAGSAEHIVLVPSGMLGMLPLHAAWTSTNDRPDVRRYLLNERTVSYTPNARALAATAQVAARTPAARLVVVADPQPTARKPIGYASVEAAWATRWFSDSTILTGTDVTRDAVIASMSASSVHHFICHGLAQSEQPLDSALILGGDETLTLRDIMSLRLWRADEASHTQQTAGVRLAILSACDTDRPGTKLPDEVIGLPSGLIEAGVAGVVATQWEIRSESASLLMARFYQLWCQEGLAPAAALRAAQCWMRDTTNSVKARDLSLAMTSEDGVDTRTLVRTLRLRDPDERAYVHPTDWAALSYHGT